MTVSYSAATYYSKADGSATTSSPAVDATIPLKGPSGVPMDSVTSAQNVSMTISDTQSPKANATFNLLSSNGDGTSGCVGIRDTGPGPTYEVAPRQPNVSVTITY